MDEPDVEHDRRSRWSRSRDATRLSHDLLHDIIDPGVSPRRVQLVLQSAASVRCSRRDITSSVPGQCGSVTGNQPSVGAGVSVSLASGGVIEQWSG